MCDDGLMKHKFKEDIMIILNDQKEILSTIVGNLKVVADCL